MAEHANVDVIRWFYAAFEAPDWTPAVRALLRDDVVWHLPGAHPHAGEHIGAEAVLAAMRSFNGYVRLELHDVVGNDEHAVALLKARGDRKSHRYESLEVDVFHVRDGKIAEFWSFARTSVRPTPTGRRYTTIFRRGGRRAASRRYSGHTGRGCGMSVA